MERRGVEEKKEKEKEEEEQAVCSHLNPWYMCKGLHN